MNPGVTEEIGETSRSFIDALKAQPAVLAMIICNFALLAFIYFALLKAGEFRENLLAQQHAYQTQVTALLAKCVVKEGIVLPMP